MTLLQPAMLWSLLVLAPLAAIYFLKVRPRRRPTTAYFLWEKIFQERRASSLFQRLRDAWSLVLMALAAAAICFALARPEWADERKDLILVLDTSASMASEDGNSSRIELAKDVAREIVAGLNGTQLGAIATLNGQLTYRSHLTDNPRELTEAIDAVEATGETINLAALPDDTNQPGTGRWARDHRVILISDGAVDAGRLPPRVELLKIGSPRENVGLVAADMAFIAGSSNRIGFYYQVSSTFSEPREVDLVLSTIDVEGHEQLFKVIPLTVEPGTNRPETFQLEDAPPGRWLARLDLADALEMDNEVYLAVARPDPIRVGVESADPYFLENSVQAFSGGEGLLSLVRDSPEGKLPAPEVVLAKSVTPSADNAVIFQPMGESVWWSDLGEEVEAGSARVLVEGHPALRYLDPTSIPFVGARQLTPPPGAQVLVADDKGLPIIYKARHEGRTALVVNIDPVAADFYFSAWFPVLVHSAATHLAGRENPLASAYRPGQAVPIPGGRDEIATTVVAPKSAGQGGDETENLAAAAPSVNGQWYTGSDELGFYQLDNPSGKNDFGVNVFAADETLVNNDKSRDSHEPLSRGRSPGQWLTLLAIVVLTAESVLYHRRKVG